MNKRIIFGSLLALSFLVIISCKSPVVPVSQRLAKVWTAQIVSENSVEVYKLGAATNVKPGYSNYSMNLAGAPNVTIKEVDGGTYSGKYTIVGDTKLSITGLTPEPTGTGGNLDFNISTLNSEGTQLVLSATQSYPKTGNTTNVYTLKAN